MDFKILVPVLLIFCVSLGASESFAVYRYFNNLNDLRYFQPRKNNINEISKTKYTLSKTYDEFKELPLIKQLSNSFDNLKDNINKSKTAIEFKEVLEELSTAKNHFINNLAEDLNWNKETDKPILNRASQIAKGMGVGIGAALILKLFGSKIKLSSAAIVGGAVVGFLGARKKDFR